MKIIVNNEIKIIDEICCLQTLLDMLIPEKQKGVALAVNASIVSKNNWTSHFLNENDAVLIIRATQGG